MKRIVLWFLSTLSVVVMLFAYHTSTSGPSVTTPAAVSPLDGSTSKSKSSASAAAPSATGAARSSNGTSATAPRKASTVTGSVVQTQWGPVQVQLSLRGGTITKVAVLQHPDGNPRDAQINSYALPILIQETQSQQSAQIDMVSGATVTSTGYLQSLQSALDRAKS